MEHITAVITARRSVRTFDGRSLLAEHLEKLRAFMRTVENPYGIPVEFRLLDAKDHGLSSPVVTGEKLYVGAKVPCGAHMEEAFGYSFEALVLYAHSLGLGTVWLGGTMDRGVFARAMELGEGEKMPCVSPVGYPAAKMSVRESVMRKGVRADSRMDFEELFFDGGFQKPLTRQAAGALAQPLELVRLGPSAVNRQPWRAVMDGAGVHFYLKHAKGFTADGPAGDMQKIDLGIALCHFHLGIQEAGMKMTFALTPPEYTAPAGMEYIASFLYDE